MSETDERMQGFHVVIAQVREATGLGEQGARDLLELVADVLVREVLMRQQRVVWPRLGTFRPFTQEPREVQLESLKRTGHLHEGAPARALIARMRKLRFRPSKSHALLKGVR